ncbi:hypothetical protein F8M41_012529 [Gigaspora margarita]|uniref:Uncharacterized protein n=1 Tax=Gigaspora margarita TaxID=4874 RepID=A0A8H4EPI8_GIGMA|nr:hypothetical protein F8M41_012529 [Gigaspora margarita]
MHTSIISEYFSSLDDNGKLIIKEFGIITDFPNTLFNYARFLKVLDLSLFGYRVDQWINFQLSNMEKNSKNKFKYDITNLLLKILIKSGATLSTLILNDSDIFKVNSEISYLLERNTHFFSQLQDLFFKICNVYDTQQLHVFISIIKSQQHLEWFKFHGNEKIIPEYNEEVISASENQNRVLKGIQIAFCKFNTEFEVLRKFEHLEAISIVEKSGPLLQQLKLDSGENEIYSQSLLLVTLINFCQNITYLYISSFKLSDQFLNLINCLQKLQFLSLCWLGENLLMTVEDYNSDFIDALIRFCERKKTLNCVNFGYLHYDRSGTSKERFGCYSVINDDYWKEIQNDLEGHVELVEYESILVKLFEDELYEY